MQPRRSKVVPNPLVYPDKSIAAAAEVATGDGGTTAEETTTATATNGGVQRPRLFRVASPAVVQPSAIPMSSLEPFSPELNVYRGSSGGAGITASIPPKTTVLVDHHVTNTGALVRLEQADYSKAMRAYRVCRVEGGGIMTPYGVCPTPHHNGTGSNATPMTSTSASGPGGSSSAGAVPFTSSGGGGGMAAATANPTSASAATISSSNGIPSVVGRSSRGGLNEVEESCHRPAPWRVVLLRLFGAADVALLAIAVACFLVIASRLRISPPSIDDGTSAASASWVVSLLAGLVTHGGSGVGAAQPDAQPVAIDGSDVVHSRVGAAAHHTGTGSSDRSSPNALTPSSAGAAATAASYTQATHAASLDISVTFALLFLSVLLLAKRLSAALTRAYIEEVLVMRGVGLQFSSYGVFNTLRYRMFVDLQMLRSLVIHDAFFRYQPIFYLSSSVENKPDRVVYFPDTLPRLAVLRPVLNGIRAVLYGEQEEGPSLAELEERWKTSSREISEGEFLAEDSFAEDTVTTPDEGRSSDGTDHEEEE